MKKRGPYVNPPPTGAKKRKLAYRVAARVQNEMRAHLAPNEYIGPIYPRVDTDPDEQWLLFAYALEHPFSGARDVLTYSYSLDTLLAIEKPKKEGRALLARLRGEA